jgi:branched-chain amino acid transport system substrate-binding protein
MSRTADLLPGNKTCLAPDGQHLLENFLPLFFANMSARSPKKIKLSFRNISLCLFLAGIFLIGFSLPLFADPFNDKPNLTESYQQAESFFHAGDFEKARPLYQKYIADHPQGIKASRVLYRLGQMDQANRSFSTALRYYRFLLEKFPKRSDRVRFLMGECHYELGQYFEAQGFFRQVAGRHPDIKLRMEALFYLGKIDEKKFDYTNAIDKLVRVYAQNNNHEIKKFALASVEKIINESLSLKKITSLINRYPNGFPADLLFLKLISIYRNQSDIINFQNYAADFIAKFPKHSERAMILRQLKSLETNPSGKVRVGVVLPLTGKRAIVGQQVLQGVQLALNQLGVSAKEKVELVVKDSAAGTPLTGIISELAGDPFMAGIIGPVLSGEIKSIVPIVDKFKIPVFTPTASSDGLPDLSPFIFRNALTRGIQARFLAQYSINRLNLRRFAILYPVETYGIEFSKLFKKEVEALGGEVVASVSYDREQTDFRTQILELGGLPDKQLERIAKENLLNGGVNAVEAGTLSRPVVDMGHWNNEDIENFKSSLELNYDAIFIPGFYDKVGLIVPQLVFYNIDDVVLLGANGWNSPKLVKNAGKYIKEGFYVDGFFADSNRLGVQKFVEAFKATFGKEPALHSAQAYDSANMMLQSILEGADNRVMMKERLTGVKNYPGISGTTTLLPSGDAEKKLFTLRIKNRKVQQMD